MSGDISKRIPGNIPDGTIRGQHLNLNELTQKILANELFECSLTGEASALYGELGPNLISCKLDNVSFPSGVSHFDAKDTLFLHSQVCHKFDRIMATQCAFRDATFHASTLRDTAIIDSLFEDVLFADCDFSVTTFKSNVFRRCSFVRCRTSNKLFEHCLFFECAFSGITLQEGSILQNYGIRESDTVDLSIYRAETGEPLSISDLVPKSRLERISLAYFKGHDLNECQDLLETVQFNLQDVTRTNILHFVTGVKQLTFFLIHLYSEGLIIFFFPLQMFWSIDHLLMSRGSDELPLNVLDALEISAARLRRLYEEVFLSIPPSETYHLLVSDEYREEDLELLINELQIGVTIKSFRRFNSPSLAEIASPDAFNLLLLAALILSTRFRAEVDHYRAKRKLLDVGAQLISDGGKEPTISYQALIALNVPRFVYVRLSAKISLSLISRLRRMVLRILDVETPHPVVADAQTGADFSPSVTILFLAANPTDTVRLRLDREISAIDAALRVSGLRARFRLEQAWAVGDRELQDSLLRHQPDVVHLSAHGTRSGKPVLEVMADECYSDAPSSGAKEESEEIRGLAQVFEFAGNTIRCLVLNACHSAEIAEALSLHVGCVIGMSDSISDDAAIRFSWGFYNSVGYGKNIKECFGLAVAQLSLAGYNESFIPRLFEGRQDPSSVVLVSYEGQ